MLDPKDLKPGQEQSESYYSHTLKRYMWQYDYRDHDGKLYSAIGKSREEAKEKAMRNKEIGLRTLQISRS